MQHWDAILIYIIVGKLDKTSVRDWESQKNGSDLPTLNVLKSLLTNSTDFQETFDFNHGGYK